MQKNQLRRPRGTPKTTSPYMPYRHSLGASHVCTPSCCSYYSVPILTCLEGLTFCMSQKMIQALQCCVSCVYSFPTISNLPISDYVLLIDLGGKAFRTELGRRSMYTYDKYVDKCTKLKQALPAAFQNCRMPGIWHPHCRAFLA